MLMLALPLLMAVPALAQQEEQAHALAPYWYVQPQAGASWTVGEDSFGKLLSPAASLSLGRQVSPLFGIRFGASGWQGRNWKSNPSQKYTWNYVQASLDATLSLSRLALGYQPDCPWNVYAFLGAGLNVAFGNDDANDMAVNQPTLFAKVWDGSKLFPALRGGLGVEYAVNPCVAVSLEANANILPDKWNSKKGANNNVDWQNHLLIGVKIALGKTTDSVAAENHFE